MEVANTIYYNDFDLKLIEDALYELSAAKLDYGERKFVLRTGEVRLAAQKYAVKNWEISVKASKSKWLIPRWIYLS